MNEKDAVKIGIPHGRKTWKNIRSEVVRVAKISWSGRDMVVESNH